MKIKSFLFIIFSLFLTIVFVSISYAQDSVTITTYYPAPYGEYQQVRLTPSGATVNSACSGPGTMTFSSAANQLLVCSNNSTWQPAGGTGGQLWVREESANNVMPASPLYHVTIGTDNVPFGDRGSLFISNRMTGGGETFFDRPAVMYNRIDGRTVLGDFAGQYVWIESGKITATGDLEVRGGNIDASSTQVKFWGSGTTYMDTQSGPLMFNGLSHNDVHVGYTGQSTRFCLNGVCKSSWPATVGGQHTVQAIGASMNSVNMGKHSGCFLTGSLGSVYPDGDAGCFIEPDANGDWWMTAYHSATKYWECRARCID